MAIPPLSPAPATPDKYGSDPAAFDVAMQAWLDWQASRAAQDPAFLAWIESSANAIASNARDVQADRILCAAAQAAVSAQSPVAKAAEAAASAALAAIYASQAQATTPDSPVRLNLREINANFTVPAAYNAASVGPIAIADGVTVTVADNATYAIQ